MKNNQARAFVARNDKKEDQSWLLKRIDRGLGVGAQAAPWGCPEYSGKGRQKGIHGGKKFVNSRLRFRQKMALEHLLRSDVFTEGS